MLPFGGPHSNKAVSPAATLVSFGCVRKSSRSTEMNRKRMLYDLILNKINVWLHNETKRLVYSLSNFKGQKKKIVL